MPMTLVCSIRDVGHTCTKVGKMMNLMFQYFMTINLLGQFNSDLKGRPLQVWND